MKTVSADSTLLVDADPMIARTWLPATTSTTVMLRHATGAIGCPPSHHGWLTPCWLPATPELIKAQHAVDRQHPDWTGVRSLTFERQQTTEILAVSLVFRHDGLYAHHHRLAYTSWSFFPMASGRNPSTCYRSSASVEANGSDSNHWCSVRSSYLHPVLLYQLPCPLPADQSACIWGVECGRVVLQYTGHSGSVNSVRFHPTRELVLTASGDHTAHVWQAAVSHEHLVSTTTCLRGLYPSVSTVCC